MTILKGVSSHSQKSPVEIGLMSGRFWNQPTRQIATLYIHICFPLEHHDKLNEMIQQLSMSLTGVKHEQEYMEVRDRVHRASKYFFSCRLDSYLNRINHPY